MTGEAPYQAVILDFDNVILESVDVKTRAFAEIFSDHPDHVGDIVRYHLENGGVSRFEKFRHIYDRILKIPLTEERFQELCVDFSAAVYGQVLKCPFVPGAEEFLRASQGMYDLFIVSATPQDEIRSIVRDLGLASFFKGVFGSPVKKDEHICRIVEDNNYGLDGIVFIGDAASDYEAARSAGCDFIGRIPPGKPDIFSGLPGVRGVINDFTDMDGRL